MVSSKDKLEGCGIQGITLGNARDITEAFLMWFKEWLEEHEPSADSTINRLDNVLADIPSDIDELEGNDEE